jgi:hypothetical protein
MTLTTHPNLVPEFFDAKHIICITFPDYPGEGSVQVRGFKIWPGIGYSS